MDNAKIAAQVALEAIHNAPEAYSRETVEAVLANAEANNIHPDTVKDARDAFEAGMHWTERH